MARRRRIPAQAHHERWLVSYADFITLLFAFFVVLYANSQTNHTRAQAISEAFRHAMEEGKVSQALARLLGTTSQPQPLTGEQLPLYTAAAKPAHKEIELLPSLRQLNERLKKEIDAGRVAVRMETRGLVISLREATFFPSGTDLIEPGTYPILEVIATELKRHPNPIRLEGHTDAVPIKTARFRSNWELSAARGIAMLELFAERFQLPREHLAIAGFADTAPVAPNDTPEGRAQNRRVDIVVLNEEAVEMQPRQSGQASEGSG